MADQLTDEQHRARAESKREQAWAHTRRNRDYLRKWAEDESNDPVVRSALFVLLGELHLRDYDSRTV